MHSMTAFSRVQQVFDAFELTCELKSVNHRFLDLSFRLPESLRSLEFLCRPLLNKMLSRGRIEIHLQIKSQMAAPTHTLNQELLESYLEKAQWIHKTYGLTNDMTVSHCFHWPDIWKDNNHFSHEDLVSNALICFEEALTKLIAARHSEGRAIKSILNDKLSQLQTHVTAIEKEILSQRASYPSKIRDKISLVTNVKIDEERLASELAIFLMRLDITEELDRLKMHFKAFSELLNSQGQLGRRLDFLVQELHRETNTIASKTDSKQISQLSIDMKVLIEQLREQIQNVE